MNVARDSGIASTHRSTMVPALPFMVTAHVRVAPKPVSSPPCSSVTASTAGAQLASSALSMNSRYTAFTGALTVESRSSCLLPNICMTASSSPLAATYLRWVTRAVTHRQ